MALGIPLLLVSFLLISSITISVVDKFKHSSCGPSCGYSLAKTHIINPIDESFRAMNEVFPIDCIFFALLVLYIFLACVSGMVGLGVRFFFVHLYPIQKGRTLPNAFLMAAWLLQLMVLVINMQVSVIAPSYATFGNQYWLNETSQEKVACDTHLIGVHPNHCVQTQLGKFLNTMAVETPFFSVILFYGNLAFLAFFVLFLAHGVFVADNGAKEATDEFRALQEESDEEI
jgi:LMBR1 domain-containing protein 1